MAKSNDKKLLRMEMAGRKIQERPTVHPDGSLTFWVTAVDKNKVPNRIGFVFDWESRKDVQLKNFKANPVVLYGHMSYAPPVGRVERIELTDTELRLFIRIAPYEELQFLRDLYRDDYMRAVSIGFYVRKYEEVKEEGKDDFVRVLAFELVEVSLVTIGAHVTALKDSISEEDSRLLKKFAAFNEWAEERDEKHILYTLALDGAGELPVAPEAQRDGEPAAVQTIVTCDKCGREMAPGDAVSVAEGGSSEGEAYRLICPACALSAQGGAGEPNVQATERWRAIPYSRHGDAAKAPEGKAWDGPGEVRRAEVTDLKKMCTAEDAENLENKSAYKLPHHTAAGNKVVWRGVAAAMGVVLGARGGVKLPENVKKGVYNHLKKHYTQFDREAPDYQSYDARGLATLQEEGLILISGAEEAIPAAAEPAEGPEEQEGREISKKNVAALKALAKKATEIADGIESFLAATAKDQSAEHPAADEAAGQPEPGALKAAAEKLVRFHADKLKQEIIAEAEKRFRGMLQNTGGT